MKIHLATFYSFDLKRSATRFKSQAEEMGVYDHIHLFNPNDLNDDFKKYVLSLIKKGKKRVKNIIHKTKMFAKRDWKSEQRGYNQVPL